MRILAMFTMRSAEGSSSHHSSGKAQYLIVHAAGEIDRTVVQLHLEWFSAER